MCNRRREGWFPIRIDRQDRTTTSRTSDPRAAPWHNMKKKPNQNKTNTHFSNHKNFKTIIQTQRQTRQKPLPTNTNHFQKWFFFPKKKHNDFEAAHLLNSIERANVVERVDGGWQSTMQTKNFVFNHRRQWQIVEQIGEHLPHVGVAVLTKAFVVKTVPRNTVKTKQRNTKQTTNVSFRTLE